MGKKIYARVEGNTLDSHKTFLKKLKKRGAKTVDSEDESEATILFCPIVSRFETDISAALHSIKCQTKVKEPSDSAEKETEKKKKLIVVAMHHTFNENYPLTERQTMVAHPEVDLFVDCLFFEKKGLLKCPRNKKAKKLVCEELGLKKKLP